MKDIEKKDTFLLSAIYINDEAEKENAKPAIDVPHCFGFADNYLVSLLWTS